ncbi:MAG: exopolyphosphatase-like protein phosphoesterase RecJ protein [Candidatus Doudnabacteria bacterium]|nr:exopolyphosphatase-like protein phosphoesterase RecJ protein [Candidatus Doudnabacteria bacterium]
MLELPEVEQLFELLGKSQRIIMALPASPNGDTLGGSLALAEFLKKMNKQVEIYCQKEDFGNLSFLPGVETIKHEIVFPKSFVISLSTENAKLEELSYNVLPDKVNIYLKPKQGNFSEKDLSFNSEFPGFDLIICIDTPSLESLGALYEKNAEMFFSIPKVNIDNHITNDNYANINIVDVTASSTSEILLDLLKKYEGGLIDERIATNLLTGIIAETNSFQHNKTTPNSFLKASELISLGAKQQEIIKNLFKTKELPVLKLWGRAMARIKALPEFSSTYSVVSLQDIEKSEADQVVILKVAEDLAASITDSKLSFLAVEQQNFVEVFVSSNPNIKLQELVNYFGGSFVSDSLAKFEIKDKAITEVESIIVKALTELKPRLGL